MYGLFFLLNENKNQNIHLSPAFYFHELFSGRQNFILRL